MAPRPTRVVLADDQPLIFDAYTRLLAREPEFELVATVTDLPAVERVLAERRPDVLVLDLWLPHSVVPALPGLLAAAPGLRILVLTGDADPASTREALAAGAHGYQLKTATLGELVAALQIVAGGERYVDPRVGLALVSPPDDVRLSEREQEVLGLLAAGHTNREAGDLMGLSTRTVEGHRARIQLKLGCTGRRDLVRAAAERGLARGAA